MAILNSVGSNGSDEQTDVKVIQAALNLVEHPDFQLARKLSVDGLAGNSTLAAIKLFQEKVVGLANPDGRIDPNGNTIAALSQHIIKDLHLSLDALIAIMAHGSHSKIETFQPLLNSEMPNYQISSPLRIAHFLAQLGHESLSFTYTEEIASGEDYEGRADLGNTEPGDGKRFKGRGLIQLTGRANYAAYSEHANLDLLTRPNEHLVSNNPVYALDVSLWFWDKHALNALADEDDVEAITRKINGGTNGLADRKAYLARAKFFLLV
ncbi:putative chitinase [Alteromonadaceae bacterium 2753L.S.0a.02]|nr:putative chitinase [Alteromonadaceae bacterium 2753L.S.0a.02]